MLRKLATLLSERDDITVGHTAQVLLPFMRGGCISLLWWSIARQCVPGRGGIGDMNTAVPHAFPPDQIQAGSLSVQALQQVVGGVVSAIAIDVFKISIWV